MVDLALAWLDKLSVEVGGAGTVVVVPPRLLVDRLGLCTGLAEVMARSGFFRRGIGGRWWTRRARWPRERRA
ncbi:MAG: hypothetical protein ACRD0H_04255 [Actinomycetes bacterium]